MNSIKVCEYSRSRSFHDDLILQDQASGERSQDQWSSGYSLWLHIIYIGFSRIIPKLLKYLLYIMCFVTMEQMIVSHLHVEATYFCVNMSNHFNGI